MHRLLQCHAKFAKPECRDEPCSCSTVLIFWKLDTGRSTLLIRSMKLVPCLSGEQLERTLQGRLVLCPHRFPFTTYFACCIGCKQRSVLQMEEWDMIINQLLKVVTIFPPIVSSFFYVSMSENCSFKKRWKSTLKFWPIWINAIIIYILQSIPNSPMHELILDFGFLEFFLCDWIQTQIQILNQFQSLNPFRINFNL